MTRKLTIPLHGDDVAPRFDLATEAMIMEVSEDNDLVSRKTIALPRSSADDLCQIILSEKVTILICGAIEEEYYQFLKWKELEIFDSIVGSWSRAFETWREKRLHPGDTLCERIVQGKPLSS